MRCSNIFIILSLFIGISFAESIVPGTIGNADLMRIMQNSQKPKTIPKKVVVNQVQYISQPASQPAEQKTIEEKPIQRNLTMSKSILPLNDVYKKIVASIPATMLNVRLKGDLYSFNNQIPVIAELVSDFHFGNVTIPAGSLFVGVSGLARIGSNRLDIAFTKLITRTDEDSIKNNYTIDAVAMSNDGTFGIIGNEFSENSGGILDFITLGLLPFIVDTATSIVNGNKSSSAVVLDNAGKVISTKYDKALKLPSGTLFKVLIKGSVEK